MKKFYLLVGLLIYGALLKAQTNTFPSAGNVGVGTTSPISALQIGNFLDGSSVNQLIIPGNYNFEQVRFGQIGNGNSALEFTNHIGVSTSYGIRFLVDTDHGAKGLQLQYAGSSTAYTALNYQTGFYMSTEGGIGINTTVVPSGYKLAVSGNMIAESVKVKLQSAWPDYVFNKEYELPSLQSTEQHIKEKGHLPGIPSAAEVNASGINLGEMNAKLLQKIEEITLHLIEQNKAIELQNKKMEAQQIEINKLKTKNKL